MKFLDYQLYVFWNLPVPKFNFVKYFSEGRNYEAEDDDWAKRAEPKPCE